MKRFGRETRGQSAVEIALALPILLLLVLGIGDLGRFAYYAIAAQNAAREGAAFAAKNPAVTTTMVHSRVCAEVQFGGSGCPTVTVVCTRGSESCDTGRPAANVQVRVTFDLPLLTGVIAQHVGMSALPLRGEATLPGYTQ
jgi:Flp pilus assembly protein TadG